MSFCKIHNSTQYGDMLVMRGYEPETEKFTVSITIEYRKCLVKASINAESKETMNEMFDGMDAQRTEQTLNEILP